MQILKMVKRKYLKQEIMVHKIIPAIKRGFALAFIERGINQRTTAQFMGTTEAAICNYVKKKRGCNVKLPNDIKLGIARSVQEIVKEGFDYFKYLQYTVDKEGVKTLCERVYKKQ